MDINENNIPGMENQPVAQQSASPFVNSPYVMPQEQTANRPYTPAPAANPAPKKETKPARKGVRGWHLVLTAAIMLVVAIVACCITAYSVNQYWKKQNTNYSQSIDERLEIMQDKIDNIVRPGAENGDSSSGTPNVNPTGGMTPAQVYAQNVESVVAINCMLSNGSSSGSGFVMTEDGYVITNYHVVEGATKITVVMHDETQYDATYIGGDQANDIALIKMEVSGIRAVTLGVSDNMIVGDQVVAIGNPLGELASTLTVGYVSAKDRIVATDGSQINMLQTDAAINPGNSGGPLFNMNGEVIGITSAKYSGMTNSGATIEGIGFAIPMDDVLGMLEDLKEYGYITGAYLGVYVSDVDKKAAEMYGLPMGTLVQKVEKGSCAEAAGIQKQDIIVKVGGYTVGGMNDLSRALRKYEAGEEITVTVYRNGGEVVLKVVLDEKPVETPESNVPEQSQPSSGGSIEDWFDHFFG